MVKGKENILVTGICTDEAEVFNQALLRLVRRGRSHPYAAYHWGTFIETDWETNKDYGFINICRVIVGIPQQSVSFEDFINKLDKDKIF